MASGVADAKCLGIMGGSYGGYMTIAGLAGFPDRLASGADLYGVVNVETSEVVYSTQGAGEYSLDNREVIGFGGTASYDSTLNGKVLNLAMREAVNRLVEGIESGAWQPGR